MSNKTEFVLSEREYPNCPPPISAQQSQQNLPPRSNLITLKRPLSNTNDRKAEYLKEQSDAKSKSSNKVKQIIEVTFLKKKIVNQFVRVYLSYETFYCRISKGILNLGKKTRLQKGKKGRFIDNTRLEKVNTCTRLERDKSYIRSHIMHFLY